MIIILFSSSPCVSFRQGIGIVCMKMPHTHYWFSCSPFSSFAFSLLLIDDSAVKEWVSAKPLIV